MKETQTGVFEDISVFEDIASLLELGQLLLRQASEDTNTRPHATALIEAAAAAGHAAMTLRAAPTCLFRAEGSSLTSMAVRTLDDEPDKGCLKIGPLALYPDRREIRLPGVMITNLTRTEFDILFYLAKNRERVISCRELAWHGAHRRRFAKDDKTGSRNMIRPHISNMRRKLRDQTDMVLIENVRDEGYCLARSLARSVALERVDDD